MHYLENDGIIHVVDIDVPEEEVLHMTSLDLKDKEIIKGILAMAEGGFITDIFDYNDEKEFDKAMDLYGKLTEFKIEELSDYLCELNKGNQRELESRFRKKLLLVWVRQVLVGIRF